MNARLFKHEGLAKLRAQCRRDPSIIAGYEESGTVPLEEEWLFQSSLVSTADEAPDLILESAVSQKAKAATDAENAIRIWVSSTSTVCGGWGATDPEGRRRLKGIT